MNETKVTRKMRVSFTLASAWHVAIHTSPEFPTPSAQETILREPRLGQTGRWLNSSHTHPGRLAARNAGGVICWNLAAPASGLSTRARVVGCSAMLSGCCEHCTHSLAGEHPVHPQCLCQHEY